MSRRARRSHHRSIRTVEASGIRVACRRIGMAARPGLIEKETQS
jgi:hypothetical protein